MDNKTQDFKQVVLVQSGNKDAYEQLVLKYQSQLRAFLRTLLNNESLADELAQESFISAYQKIHSFRGESSFKTWLFQLAYNIFLQHYRKDKRRVEKDKKRELEEANEFAQNQDLNSLMDLQTALNQLSDHEKSCFLLIQLEGFSYQEMAQVMQINCNSLKTIVNRTKNKILLYLTSKEGGKI